MSAAARVLFALLLIFLFNLTALDIISANEQNPMDKQSYDAIKKRMYPTQLEVSRKKDNIEILGQIKIFYSLPNSIAMRVYGHQSFESDGLITDGNQRINKIDAERLGLFRYWSLSRIHFPKNWWSWGVRFSPSLSFFNWSNPGAVTLAHIIYNAKGILNLPNALGTLFAAAGMGPMYTNGQIYSAKENHSITFAPRFQLGYYRFVNDRLFLQIKYNNYYLPSSIYKGNGFSIKNLISWAFT